MILLHASEMRIILKFVCVHRRLGVDGQSGARDISSCKGHFAASHLYTKIISAAMGLIATKKVMHLTAKTVKVLLSSLAVVKNNIVMRALSFFIILKHV